MKRLKTTVYYLLPEEQALVNFAIGLREMHSGVPRGQTGRVAPDDTSEGAALRKKC